MEQKSNTIIKNDKNKMTMNEQNLPKPKKKRGAMQLIRVALYMIRKSGKSKSSMQVDVASKSPWKKFLESMRPLHLQSNQNPPPSNGKGVALAPMIEHFQEAFSPPMSPAKAKSLASSSSVDGLSQYASALNLQELDTSEEDNGDHDYNDGDEMIDAKAEEFINQFYEQMKVQHFGYINSSNEEKD